MNQMDRVEAKVDSLHEKLDGYSQRTAALEEAVTWIKGHITVVTAGVLAALGWLASMYFNRG